MELSHELITVPFDVNYENPEIQRQAERIFQILYSEKAEEIFGSGKDACLFILEAFARMVTSAPVSIYIKELGEEGTMGRYLPLRRTIELESGLLDGKEDDFVATVLHEMTHALHYNFFVTAADVEEGSCKEELGCGLDCYRAALHEAARKIPHSLTAELPLACKMRIHYFLPPADLVREGRCVLGYNEFLARVPEMYCRFGKIYSAAVISDSLKEIFPLSVEFFWGIFKTRCQGAKPSVEEPLDYHQIGQDLFTRLQEEENFPQHFMRLYDRSEVSVTIIYDFLRHSSWSDDDTRECLKNGSHVRGRDLMLGEAFLGDFAALSKKVDPESQDQLKRILQQVIGQISSLMK